MSDEPKPTLASNCPSCGKRWNKHPGAIKMCDELTRLRAENERLAGIVGKLPLLADGVRAVPGMTIYEVYGDHIQTHRNIGWITRDSGYVTLWFSDGHSALHEWNNCYSTLEAAEAARGKA